MSTLQDAVQLVQDDTFVSIREIQKSPTRALDGFKIVMNNGKMQGVYIPQEELENYVEDLQAMSSSSYMDLIQQARKSNKTSSKEVRSSLGV